MLWKFNSVYHPELQIADHRRPVTYQMRLPARPASSEEKPRDLFVLRPEPARQMPPAG
jgi:hypothetical protein